MSSVDNRQSSATTGHKRASRLLTLPSRVSGPLPVEQSPYADDTSARLEVPPVENYQTAPRFLTLPSRVSGPLPVGQSSYVGDTPALLEVPPTGNYQTAPRFLTLPSRVSGPLPVEVAPVAEDQASSRVTSPLIEPVGLSRTTVLLPESAISSNATRQLVALPLDTAGPLTVTQTGMLPSIKIDAKSLRQPVVIPGAGKKSVDVVRLSKRQRWILRTVLMGLIVLVAVGTLLTVLPVDNQGNHTFDPVQSISNLVHSNSNNPSSIAQPDGYDPGAGGSQGLLPGNASGNSFPYGQCTYWADSRYHQLTGFFVPWRGNAYAWAYAAGQYGGWVVSSKPHVPSIIVLQGGVQGAGGYGHVAVVERINSDGSVETSNMNWYATGGWGRVSSATFRPGSGVTFVWHS